MLRGRFIALQAYLKKQEKSQINNLTLHLQQLEKEEMKNPSISRRKEILKIRAEINAKETKETIAKMNKAKSWFFKKINKIDKPLARLIKKQGRRTKLANSILIVKTFSTLWASVLAQAVKNLPAMKETPVQYLGQEDSLEKGKAAHSSTLAWRSPRTEEPGGLQSTGSQRVGHN